MKQFYRSMLLAVMIYSFLPAFSQEQTMMAEAEAVPVKEASDSLVDFLASLDIDPFLDSTVSSFASLISPYASMPLIQTSDRRGYRHMAVYSFHDRPYLQVKIYFRNMVYVNPNGFSKKKQARKLLREKPREINIYHDSICLNGCSD